MVSTATAIAYHRITYADIGCNEILDADWAGKRPPTIKKYHYRAAEEAVSCSQPLSTGLVGVLFMFAIVSL